MKVKIQIVIESDNGIAPSIYELIQIERNSLQPENLGLSLTEAKTLLRNTQQNLVQQQTTEYEKQHSSCLDCGSKLLHKEQRQIIYRTLFGKLKLPASRLFYCGCSQQKTRSFSPLVNLLKSRTSPELLYLESKESLLNVLWTFCQILRRIITNRRRNQHNSSAK